MNNYKIEFNNRVVTIPANKSIVVFATPRTGTTALCNLLYKKTNLPVLGEIFTNTPPLNATGCPESRVPVTGPGIIKIFPNHIIPADQQHWLTESFVIGLRREDLIAQTVSYYTAAVSKQFAKTKSDTNINTVTIPFDTMLEKKLVIAYWELLSELTSKYNSHKELFDIELTYEDIITDLAESDFVIQEKSTNYDVVYNYFNNLK